VAAALALTAGLTLGGCMDTSGDFASDPGGSLDHVLTQKDRLAPDTVLSKACGADVRTPLATKIMRTPYLQKVTDGSATVMLASSVSADLTVDYWPAASGAVATGGGTSTASDATLVPAAASTPASVHTTVEKGVKPGGGGLQHVARIDGLSPATTYCYSVRQGDNMMVGPTAFTTAPSAGQSAPVRFIAVGDSGEGSADQLAILKQLRTVPFQFMLHVGDIAYDSGTREQLEQYFFDIYAGLLKSFPSFPISGNHDYGTEDGAPFREAFALPENGGPNGKERWYSFDWGDVHFVALDTEKTSAEQARWLEEDLGKNRLPWTIVYGHKPPFSSGYHGNDGPFQQYFVPILEKHKVPLVLNGHDHNYERTKPINGVTYVVTGGGGRGTKGVGKSSFTAFSDAVLNFVYVTIDGDLLTLHAIDGNGKEFDSVQVKRPGA
jgi:hypothetical protein